jgi:hypothetical protein
MTKGGTNTNKDVIYIDVDDEITGIIDKVQSSGKKIVALVLPKRATVLQSVVNMKLLKRAAGESKKNLVLITAESGLLPLAGSVGLHVAKSLSSKPEVPDAPERPSDKPEIVDESGEGEDVALDESRTVGELSGTDPIDDHETIELDDEATVETAASSKADKLSKLRKFKIPNFNKFRIILALAGVGVLVLSIVGYAAVAVWPKAKITIKTDSETVASSVVLNLKSGEGVALEAEKAIVPAQKQEVKKTLTQEAPATGQQNNGEKAAGTVTMTAKNCSSLATPKDVPAGTGITTNGKTYITKEKANFSGSGTFDGSCLNFQDTGVSIAAQTGGAGFNVTSASFTVAGRSDVTASGSASGGTDDILKVVSQADVDAAKQKITEQDTKPIQQELRAALIGRNLYAIDVTFGVGPPETKLSAEVNTEAETVTVTQTIAYSMFGVKQDDLEKVVGGAVKNDIDTKKQTILSYGLDDAFFSIQGLTADSAMVSMQATAVAGAELHVETIKKQVAGKKAGEARSIISASPGVTDVDVQYSPFWVGSIPKKTNKITIVIEEPETRADDTESSP